MSMKKRLNGPGQKIYYDIEKINTQAAARRFKHELETKNLMNDDRIPTGSRSVFMGYPLKGLRRAICVCCVTWFPKNINSIESCKSVNKGRSDPIHSDSIRSDMNSIRKLQSSRFSSPLFLFVVEILKNCNNCSNNKNSNNRVNTVRRAKRGEQ